MLIATIGIAFGSCDGTPQPPKQAPSSYRDQILADHPAGYWRLDELSGTVAFSATNAPHGTISNGVTLGYSGATADGDTAMFFDGRSGQVVVPSAPSLEMKKGSVTLEVWVKYIGEQRGQVTLLGKGAAGVQTEYALVLVAGVPGYQSVVERYLSAAPALKPGVWTHLAVTVADNAVGTFYMNGSNVGTFSEKTGHIVTSSTNPATVANLARASEFFVGGIDEPAIYSYPLTADQLARHFKLASEATHP
jgi:hypothetical protein